MLPIVDGLEAIYRAQLVVKRIDANAEAGPHIMRAYHIPGHPTILIFDRQGQEIQRFVGPQPVEAVEEIIKELLK